MDKKTAKKIYESVIDDEKKQLDYINSQIEYHKKALKEFKDKVGLYKYRIGVLNDVKREIFKD